MFKTIQIIVLAALCLNFTNLDGAKAQANRPLKIGDQVPEEFWNLSLEITNLKDGERLKKLSEYQEEAIILDFGNTHCAPCVASLTHLDTLKNHFPGRLITLGVTSEKSDYLITFLKRRKAAFSYIANNTVLKDKMFPYVTFPHLIWLKKGKVIAITDRNKVTFENLQLFMNDELKLPPKFDLHGVDESMPLTMSGFSAINNTLIYQSSVAGFIPGVIARSTIEQVRDQFDRPLMQMQMTNHSLFDLFETAVSPQYFNYEIIYPNRIIWEISDSIKDRVMRPLNLKGDSLERWNQVHRYSYNLVVPLATSRIKMYELMGKELNHFCELTLGINARVEKRTVKMLALVRTTEKDLIKSVSAKPTTPMVKEKTTYLQYVNRDFASLVYSLQQFYEYLPLPLIDETGYSGNIDLSLQMSDDLAKVRLALQQYGMDLVEKEARLNMLIISKIPNN